MKMLGKSVQSRYFEILGRPEEAPFPEDGYKGDYIYEIAQEIIDREGDKFLHVRWMSPWNTSRTLPSSNTGWNKTGFERFSR